MKLSEEILQKNRIYKKDNLISENDDEAFFIADPFLASIVNENDEIIVNDTLYRFTERGLFFTHVKDSIILFNFLEKEINKKAIAILKEDLNPCNERELYGGTTINDEGVSMYIRPMSDECYSGGSGGSTTPSSPKTSEEVLLQQIINTLPISSGEDHWFQNLFGKSYTGINNFDDRHRVKIEFWDQEWLVYKSVGVQVKTQKRVLGVWWETNSDEIHLGINRILLKYNYPQPDISSITHPKLFNNIYKAPVYLFKGDINVKKNIFGQHYVQSKINVTKNNLPFFDFGNQDILNIYIPNLPIVDDYNLNLTTQDIVSQSNIKELYKMGIDFLEDNLNSGAKKEFIVTYQKNINEISVLYFGERYKETNESNLKRKFHKDFSIKAGVTLSGENNWSYSVEPAPELFRDYTHYELDFYGMAKRGSTWKGIRMIK